MRNNKLHDTTMEDKENEPRKKKVRLSPSKNRNRFIHITEHELSEAKRGYLFFRLLHSDGIGTKPCCSEVISQEEEELLWSKGVLGTDSPQKLLNAIFFNCGLNFCLRGGDEHRSLKVSQLERVVVSDPANPGYTTVCYELLTKIT